MSGGSSTGTILEEETTTGSGTTSGWKTVLFNCECHTFDHVERQLIKAVRCTLSRAREISWEVHSKGSSVVYEGVRERCEAVADTLGATGLIVNVTQ